VRARALVFLALPAALPAACFSRATEVSVVSLDRLRVVEQAGPRVSVELTLTVKTNAPVDSTITVLAYELAFGNDPPIVRGGRLPPVEVPAGGVVQLVLPAELGLAQLPRDLPALAAKGSLPYRAIVWTESTSVAGTHQHRLEPKGEAPLGPTFEAVVDGAFAADGVTIVGVGPFGVEGPDLVIGVELQFPGYLPFPLQVTRVGYRLSLGGDYVGEGESREGFVVAPETGGRGKLTLRVPAVGVPGVVGKLALGQRALLVEGTVEIAPIGPVRRIPFRARTTVR